MRAGQVMKDNIYKTMKKIPVYKSSLKKCPCCHNNLSRKKEYSVVQARLFSSESITTIASQGLYCGRNRCKLYFRHNFVWLGGQKVNCMSFNEMKMTGLYFVTSKAAFTMKYLELCYLRLLRAKTSPGQEAAVRRIVHTDDQEMFWGHSSFRDHLLHALEGYAVGRRNPDQVIEFNVDFPAKHVVKMSNPMLLFPPLRCEFLCRWPLRSASGIASLLGTCSASQTEGSPHETFLRTRPVVSLQAESCPPCAT